MTTRTALVVGDSGVVGEGLARQLIADGDWEVIGVSRRPGGPQGLHHLALDLLDPSALAGAGDVWRRVTHAFVTAKVAADEPQAEADLNRRLLGNLLDVLDLPGSRLAHVGLVHGTKWYGCHRGPYPVPAHEDDERGPGPLFYFDQHDLLADRARGRDWSWSTLRPHTVWGPASGSGNSLATLIGIYATLLREAGQPLSFPGGAANFAKRSQATTAGLLARGLIWAGTTPGCAGQDINLTNGDVFRWRDLWPRIAAFFDMAPAPPATDGRLADRMPPLEPLWDEARRRRGLAPLPLAGLVDWRYGDGLFGVTWDDVSSLDRARSLGWTERIDSGDAMLGILGDLRTDGILP